MLPTPATLISPVVSYVLFGLLLTATTAGPTNLTPALSLYIAVGTLTPTLMDLRHRRTQAAITLATAATLCLLLLAMSLTVAHVLFEITACVTQLGLSHIETLPFCGFGLHKLS